MSVDTLQTYEEAELKVRKQLIDAEEQRNFIESTDVTLATNLLENLIKLRIQELNVFELMLKINATQAIKLIIDLYLSQDLSHHPNDPAEDLKTMFCQIKNVLGEDELKKILDSNNILLKNRNNLRVKKAIISALKEDSPRQGSN